MNAIASAACAIFLTTAAYAAPETATPGTGVAGVKFNAYDGNPQSPEKMEFQIKLPNGRAAFLKIGDMVNGTKLKVAAFQFKEVKNASGKTEDVSELTLRDTVSEKTFVLQIGKAIDSK